MDGLKQGENTIQQLASKRNSNHGTITINITSKNVVNRSLKLRDLKVTTKVSADLIG